MNKNENKEDHRTPPMSAANSDNEELRELEEQRNRERQELRDTDRQRRERDAKEQAGIARSRGVSPSGASATDALTGRLSAQILTKAWLSCLTGLGALIAIPYINFHFIVHYIGGPFSRFFCAPGDEWNITGKLPVAGAASATSPTFKLMGYLEVALIVLIDVALFIGLMIQASLYAMIAYAYLHPVETFVALWTEAFRMFWYIINP